MEKDSKKAAKGELDSLFILPLMGNAISDPMRGGFAVPFGLDDELLSDEVRRDVIPDHQDEEDELRK